jgi:hypothetical protein
MSMCEFAAAFRQDMADRDAATAIDAFDDSHRPM